MGILSSKNKQNKKSVQVENVQKTDNIINTNQDILLDNKKHLIVDDASSNRLVLRRYLEIYGCTVDEAENGLDALRKIKTCGKYKVIWMDIKMPKMDGIDCTRYLREELNYSGPIISLSGYVDEVTIRRCYETGVNHVMSKPFDKGVIQMYVEKFS